MTKRISSHSTSRLEKKTNVEPHSIPSPWYIELVVHRSLVPVVNSYSLLAYRISDMEESNLSISASKPDAILSHSLFPLSLVLTAQWSQTWSLFPVVIPLIIKRGALSIISIISQFDITFIDPTKALIRLLYRNRRSRIQACASL